MKILLALRKSENATSLPLLQEESWKEILRVHSSCLSIEKGMMGEGVCVQNRQNKSGMQEHSWGARGLCTQSSTGYDLARVSLAPSSQRPHLSPPRPSKSIFMPRSLPLWRKARMKSCLFWLTYRRAARPQLTPSRPSTLGNWVPHIYFSAVTSWFWSASCLPEEVNRHLPTMCCFSWGRPQSPLCLVTDLLRGLSEHFPMVTHILSQEHSHSEEWSV